MPDEYIKRSDCLEAMKKAEKWWWNAEDLRQYYDLINSIPAADVAKVRRGRWIVQEINENIRKLFCQCGFYEVRSTDLKMPKYCEQCGAKMDGAADNV